MALEARDGAREQVRACGAIAGRVFDDRYHARVLRTPTEVRHAIDYVRDNARKHAAERGETYAPGYAHQRDLRTSGLRRHDLSPLELVTELLARLMKHDLIARTAPLFGGAAARGMPRASSSIASPRTAPPPRLRRRCVVSKR